MNYVEDEISKTQYLDPLLIRYSCDSIEYTSEDIMDYAYSLAYKITPEQKARIRHVLYYSPLIPGPKKYRTRTRAAAESEPIRFKITTIK